MGPEEIVARAREIAADVPVRGRQLCLRYADVTTAYRSDEGASVAWIERFLDGYVTPSSEPAADATVTCTADPGLYSALHELAPEQSPAGKRHYVDVPLTDSVALVRRQAEKVVPREDVYLLLFARERHIVLVTSGNPEVRQEEGMQTLRALGKWLLLEKGWIPLHAAVAAHRGRAVCVAGQKASGKTSTLLNLLARNGCDLVAVDKFLLRDVGSRLEVCGIPGKIGIRVGSAVVHPPVLDWLAATRAPFFPNIGLEDVRQIAATNTPEQLRTRPEKLHMTPAELAVLFGRSITPIAPLDLLLIPVFDLGVDESRLVRAEPDQAIRLLTNCYVSLLSKGEGFLRHLFDLDDALLEQRLAALLDRHLPGVAAFEVHQNHRTNERTAELVAGLL